jgi:ATP-dependent phosphoenolpyruvate carboxykinase
MFEEVPGGEAASKPLPIILETAQEGLVLVQMITPEDDSEYWEFQQRNREHLTQFGNVVYSNPEAATQGRLKNNRVRFGIRKEGALIGMTEYTPSKDGLEAEIGIQLDKDKMPPMHSK